MALATLTIDINAKLANLERDMGKAARIAEQNAEKMRKSFAAAGAALASIGAALSVGAFAGMVKNLADAGDKLQKLSTKTGIAVEELSKLDYAASLSDLSTEDLGTSLTKLNRVMGDAADGSKEAAAALARFGIAPDSGLSAIEVFKQIADRVKATGDETKIASALNDVFGKSFASLIPLLKEGGDGIKRAGDELERLGGVMSGDLAKSSEAFNDNITRLNKALDALKIEIIGPLIPLFLELSSAMVSVSEKSGEVSKTGQAIRTVFETLTVVGANVAFVFRGIGAEIGGIAAQIAALGRGDFKAFSAIGEAMREDAAKARKDIDALSNRLLNAGKPIEFNYGNEGRGKAQTSTAPGIQDSPKKPVNIARARVAKTKEDKYTDPLTPSAEAYAKAVESINTAINNAEKSTLNLDAAQETLHDLMKSPVWENMPQQWKDVVTAQVEAGSAAIKTADDYKRLKDIIDATPTAKLEETRDKMLLLAKAFNEGIGDIKLTAEQFSEAAITALGNIPDAAKEATGAMEEFALQAARNMQDAFADFLFDPFKDGVDGMLKGFGDVVKRMIANAVAADLSKKLFGDLIPGGEGEGWIGAGLKFLSGAIGNADGGVYASPGLSAYSGTVVSKPTLFPFASGMGLMGEAGPEAILPLKRGNDGKLGVSAGGGSNVINLYYNGTNSQEMRKSAGAVSRDVLSAISGAGRYR